MSDSCPGCQNEQLFLRGRKFSVQVFEALHGEVSMYIRFAVTPCVQYI